MALICSSSVPPVVSAWQATRSRGSTTLPDMRTLARSCASSCSAVSILPSRDAAAGVLPHQQDTQIITNSAAL